MSLTEKEKGNKRLYMHDAHAISLMILCNSNRICNYCFAIIIKVTNVLRVFEKHRLLAV